MPAIRSISDRLLYRQVATLTRAQELGKRLKEIGQDEKGQTPTEYLMIVGLMAAVIVLVFATWYWDAVKTVAKEWTAKVTETVSGAKVK